MKRTVCACAALLLTVLLLGALLLLPASAAEPGYVFDGQGLFSSDEADALEVILGNASVEAGVNFYVVTVPPYVWGEASLAAADFSAPSDSVILTLQEEDGTYYYELFTYGYPNAAVTDTEVDRILDNSRVYDNLKAGNWVDGVDAFASLTVKACDGSLRIPLGVVLPVALLLGVVAAGILCVVVLLRYKMKLRPTNYPLEHYTSLSLTREDDRFLGSHVTRRRIESSSGGHGGRSGGGGGGSRGRR